MSLTQGVNRIPPPHPFVQGFVQHVSVQMRRRAPAYIHMQHIHTYAYIHMQHIHTYSCVRVCVRACVHGVHVYVCM